MANGGTLLISDRRARLKPCLRCGYSLLYIAGARNCPECGLAVRISLSDNTGLEWSHPRWQRSLAVASGILGTGFILKLLSSLLHWSVYAASRLHIDIGDRTFRFLIEPASFASRFSLIVCAVGLCLLSKTEGRHPDTSRIMRRVLLVSGLVVSMTGLMNNFAGYDFWIRMPHWARFGFSRFQSGPWIPLMIGVPLGALAFELGKRARSATMVRLSQWPLWPLAAGTVMWLFGLDQLFWQLRPIIWEAYYPICMLIVCIALTRLLIHHAREADLNWVTD